jgi:hypothetical protein
MATTAMQMHTAHHPIDFKRIDNPPIGPRVSDRPAIMDSLDEFAQMPDNRRVVCGDMRVMDQAGLNLCRWIKHHTMKGE